MKKKNQKNGRGTHAKKNLNGTISKKFKPEVDHSDWARDLPESGYQSGFFSDFDDRTKRNELSETPFQSFTQPSIYEDMT